MPKITKEILYELYYEREMGTPSIAKLLSVSAGSVRYLLNKYGFKLRSAKESRQTKFSKERYKNIKRYYREEHPNWKGGRVKKSGRWFINLPEHPRANQRMVPEEILVAERLLGRSLEPGEMVAHLNRNSFDNSPYNLYVCKDKSEFARLNRKEFDLPLSNIL